MAEATLSATFRAVNEMSDVLEDIARSGGEAIDQWESAGQVADDAFSRATSGAQQVAQAAETATTATDHWTAALGHYDKGILEATYSTEELVEMGFKTEEALTAAAQAVDENTDAIEKGTLVMQEFRAAIDEQEAELDSLQEAYMGVVLVMGQHSDEAVALKGEIADLSGTLEENKSELEQLEGAAGKTGQSGEDAIDQVAKAFAAAGIAVLIKKITESLMECAAAAEQTEVAFAKLESLADTSVVSMSQMSAETKALSMDIGVSVDQLSEATYQAISASVDTADAVMFVQEANKLATAGFTDTTTSVDVLTTAVNAYGLEIEQAGRLSDMMITTQNLGKTSVDELASTMGKVIPVAAAYNVEMDNVSAAYAELTKGGIQTANATTYLRGMFSELGSESSTVAGILVDKTGQSFAELMESGYSLGDVLDILGETVNGDTTAFANLWGSQTAGLGAMALYNSGAEAFNDTLDAMQNSVGATAQAYDIMASTSEFSRNRMEVAHENMNRSIGNLLLPMLNDLHDTGAEAFAFVSDFVDEHPVFAKAVLAIGIGIGVAATGMIAYATATTVAKVATLAFNAVLAVNPIILAATAVVALVAGIASFISMLGRQDEEYKALSASSKQHYDHLRDLNEEYENTCETLGETSYEAQALRWEIEALEDAFESSKMTLEEFQAQNEALISSHDQLVESYSTGMGEIGKEEASAMALIGKLEQLGSATELTAAEQEQMRAIIGSLNDQIPELALSYEDLAGNMDLSVAVMKEMAEAQAVQQRNAQQYETYVDLLSDQLALEEQLAVATAERIAAEERREDVGGLGWVGESRQARKDLEALTEEEEKLQAALNETNALLAECESAFDAAAAATDEAAQATVDYETATNRAIRSVADDINDLVAAYDEAYEAARSSIDGTIGLFDTMATECELSTNDMLNAWQSQVDYLELYAENLRKAAEYGLDEGLIASLSDGSEESAGYINAMVEEIERLGGTTEEMSEAASDFVQGFNEAFTEVEEAKDEWASTVAEMETDFNNSMDEIQERMEQAIDDMAMETEAAQAAKDTIGAYVDSIKSMTGEAHSAAAGVAAAAAEGLTGISLVGVPGYATGTTNAPDVMVAGEDGAELIVGAGGSTVFPADETSRIISAVQGMDSVFAPAPRSMSTPAPAPVGGSGVQEKRLVLEIAGRGSLELGGGASPDDAWQAAAPSIKEAFLSMILQEKFEEGDLAHEY